MIFIDTAGAFAEVSSRILAAPWVAIDTEADSLHHYAEKLCLIQFSIPDEDIVVDPLVPLPLAEFFAKIQEKDLLFHAADGDIRLIKKTVPFSPKKMFDTMLAAQLLGYEKIGLQNLCERHCGIVLSKAEQKADWAQRPLTEKLIKYAANDTHYLRAIIDAMAEELEKLGRLEWHRQSCARLLETLENLKPQEDDREAAWQIKGAKGLKGKEITILRELWFWRDEIARKKDRPSFKVLNSEYLLDLSRWAAANPGKDVGEWKEGPRNARGEHRETLNALLKRADGLPQAMLEKPQKNNFRKRWTDKESAMLTELKTVRDKHASELKIHGSLIATNALLEALALEKPKDTAALKEKGMMDWQIESAGKDLLNKLAS
jgi:ribonuclease D